MKKVTSSLAIGSLIFFGFLSVSFAQETPTLPREARQTLEITLLPEHPQANSPVRIQISNYSTDMKSAYTTWIVNGTVVKKGYGETEYTVMTGKLGIATTVSVSATTQEGKIITGTKTIRPADLDLVWQADSYTPPFYKGKALYPNQGHVRVIAIPNFIGASGKAFNPKNLVYKWQRNGDVEGGASGYGKNIFEFDGPAVLQTENITLTVETLDKSIGGQKAISFDPSDSRVLLYEDHPLYGIRLERALSNGVSLSDNQIKIAAVPYFFSVTKRSDESLIYSWSINNTLDSSLTPSQSYLTFRKTGDGGIANIAVNAKSKVSVFQFAANALSITLTNVANPFTSNASQ